MLKPISLVVDRRCAAGLETTTRLQDRNLLSFLGRSIILRDFPGTGVEACKRLPKKLLVKLLSFHSRPATTARSGCLGRRGEITRKYSSTPGGVNITLSCSWVIWRLSNYARGRSQTLMESTESGREKNYAGHG